MNPDTEIYIHIPFCLRKCHYCDFLSFPCDSSLRENYIEQLKLELKARGAECEGRSISSVYIGGGTPSILGAAQIKGVMDTLYKHYHIRPGAEISIEANPASAMRHKFEEYRASGINRLSLGLQSADDRELKILGRSHSYGEFLKAFECARKEGFTNINVDLINHIPGESAASWKKTLRSVLMLKPEHISVYSLIIEPGTPFYEMKEKNLLSLPDEETVEEADLITADLMKRAGYCRYEFSNYAREGFECRHNIGYWTGKEYLGFGLGASSCCNKKRLKNVSDMDSYMRINFSDYEMAPESLFEEIEPMTRESMMEEFMYLGLRLTKGVSRTEFKKRFGAVMENVFSEPLRKYTSLKLMELSFDRYRLTERGIDISNRILADFLLH